MNQLLLAAVMFLGLLMIPFGLPGTWIIAAAALGYQILVPGSISMFTIALVFGLAVIGEVLEFTLSAKYTRKYGGSRRASNGRDARAARCPPRAWSNCTVAGRP